MKFSVKISAACGREWDRGCSRGYGEEEGCDRKVLWWAWGLGLCRDPGEEGSSRTLGSQE